MDLVANYFFSVEGINALPVRDISLLNALGEDHSAVLIPESLFQVLSKSKQVGSLLEQFDVFDSTSTELIVLLIFKMFLFLYCLGTKNGYWTVWLELQASVWSTHLHWKILLSLDTRRKW